MTGLGLLVVGVAAAAIDAATGHRASRLWSGIPERVERRNCAWPNTTGQDDD